MQNSRIKKLNSKNDFCYYRFLFPLICYYTNSNYISNFKDFI